MAALWAWCPTVALEAGNSAHVDVVAVALTAVAILVLATARTRAAGRWLGGVLLGLAIATKMTPVLTVPALSAPPLGDGRRSRRPARSSPSTFRTCSWSAAR